jgi:hypothetical protein
VPDKYAKANKNWPKDDEGKIFFHHKRNDLAHDHTKSRKKLFDEEVNYLEDNNYNSVLNGVNKGMTPV